MLTVTEAAGVHLAEILAQQRVPEDIAVRFVYEGQSIVLEHDSARDGDTTYQHDGRTVLLLDAQLSGLLAKAILDLDGAQLKLRPPGEDK